MRLLLGLFFVWCTFSGTSTANDSEIGGESVVIVVIGVVSLTTGELPAVQAAVSAINSDGMLPSGYRLALKEEAAADELSAAAAVIALAQSRAVIGIIGHDWSESSSTVMIANMAEMAQKPVVSPTARFSLGSYSACQFTYCRDIVTVKKAHPYFFSTMVSQALEAEAIAHVLIRLGKSNVRCSLLIDDSYDALKSAAAFDRMAIPLGIEVISQHKMY